MLNLKINDKIEINDGWLQIGGQVLSSYRLDTVLPSGANGRVFAGSKERDGPCVVKLWMRKGLSWSRRFERGMAEVTRTAAARSPWTVRVFDGWLSDGVFLYSMELVPGRTLRDVLKDNPDVELRWQLAWQYLQAIFATQATMHGDPHWKNVMVSMLEQDGRNVLQLKLIDFGPGWPFGSRRMRRSRAWVWSARPSNKSSGTCRDILKRISSC